MNVFKGQVSEVQFDQNLMLVTVQVEDLHFNVIIVESEESAPLLKKGFSLQVAFKETEVVIATGSGENVSMRNKIPGQILSIERGKILSRLLISSSIGEVVSIITTGAVDKLDLKQGKEVIALIKTNEMILKYD